MYDSVTRRLGAIVLLALFVPIGIGVMALQSFDRKASADLLIVVAFLAVVTAGCFLLVHLTTNVWIRIDPTRRKIFHVYKLFGYPVYQRVYDLSQFDRISLHRAFRGGYQATLVGREREVALSASWKLGWVRDAAERAAPSIGLQVSDQL